MDIYMQILINDSVFKANLRSGCLVFLVLLLAASPAISGDAELTNLILRNSNNELQVDVLIKGRSIPPINCVVLCWERQVQWIGLTAADAGNNCEANCQIRREKSHDPIFPQG